MNMGIFDKRGEPWTPKAAGLTVLSASLGAALCLLGAWIASLIQSKP